MNTLQTMSEHTPKKVWQRWSPRDRRRQCSLRRCVRQRSASLEVCTKWRKLKRFRGHDRVDGSAELHQGLAVLEILSLPKTSPGYSSLEMLLTTPTVPCRATPVTCGHVQAVLRVGCNVQDVQLVICERGPIFGVTFLFDHLNSQTWTTRRCGSEKDLHTKDCSPHCWNSASAENVM